MALECSSPVHGGVFNNAASHDLLHVLFESLLLGFQLIDEIVLIVHARTV